jgi:L-alanine-DL-glutamate epimerase-like enolase superfamily enzyme
VAPPLRITSVEVVDVRFPTSRTLDGSDAMNLAPDYSAAYVILHTDGAHEGHGFTFTTGRGTELCVAAIRALADGLPGTAAYDLFADLGAFWRRLVGDPQLRWLGPEKGVVHLATAAVVNAVWDLYAKVEGKPLWKLLADMSPEQLVALVDFRYLLDDLTPDEALDLLRAREGGRGEREAELERHGYPAYVTSAGWLGYDDAKLRRLSQEAVDAGFDHLKLKVGADLEDDRRRCAIVREVIGPGRALMVDANQVWSVPQAIDWIGALAPYDLWWVEEPTSPDDVLGHAAIARAIAPAAGRSALGLPARRLPAGRCQRGPGRPAARGEARHRGLPARRWRGVVRAGRAPVGLRLPLGERAAAGPRHRVRRPPARALHRAGGVDGRPVPSAAAARLRQPAALVARHPRVPARDRVGDAGAAQALTSPNRRRHPLRYVTSSTGRRGAGRKSCPVA